MRKLIFLFSIAGLAIMGCQTADPGSTDPGEDPKITDNYDRGLLTKNWADNFIVPGYNSLAQKTRAVEDKTQAFTSDPTEGNLDALHSAWLDAYTQWQRVAMFQVGKGDEVLLRFNMNIYPTDVEEVENNIKNEDYDLTLISNKDKQGFPAIDYMIYGLAGDDVGILAYYTTNADATKYKNYLNDLSIRINDLTQTVHNDWVNGYRDEFVANTGEGLNSSSNRMANDFILFYEKDLRAGKVGIPAGVWSFTTLPDLVEAYYKRDVSKMLCMEALDAAQDFFNGVSANGDGDGFADYLDFLDCKKDGVLLSTLINDQFDAARAEIDKLGDEFYNEVVNNNEQMLKAYDQLQLNVVLLKTDMLRALGIATDFVDSDGD